MKAQIYIGLAIAAWTLAPALCSAANSDDNSIILTKDLIWIDGFCDWQGDEASRPPDLTERRCELWGLAAHIKDLFYTVNRDAFRQMLPRNGGNEAYLFADDLAVPGCQTFSVFSFLLTCSGENWAVHYRECQDIDGHESYFVYLLPSTEDAEPTYEGLEVQVSNGAFFTDYVGTRVIKVDRGWRIVNPFRPDECSARK